MGTTAVVKTWEEFATDRLGTLPCLPRPQWLPFQKPGAVLVCQALSDFPTTTLDTAMNKAELLNTLAEQTGQAKEEIAKTLDALMDTVAATLAKGDKLLLVGFGTFEIRRRAARPGRNPQTGEPIQIEAATLPSFSPGKLLKDRVAEAHKPKQAPAKPKKAKPKKA